MSGLVSTEAIRWNSQTAHVPCSPARAGHCHLIGCAGAYGPFRRGMRGLGRSLHTHKANAQSLISFQIAPRLETAKTNIRTCGSCLVPNLPGETPQAWPGCSLQGSGLRLRQEGDGRGRQKRMEGNVCKSWGLGGEAGEGREPK